MIIFAVVHNSSGRTYIGYSENYSFTNFGTGIYIKKAIKKFGINQFSKKILEEFPRDSLLSDVLARVDFWIKQYKADDPEFGYNETIDELIPHKKKLVKKIQVLLSPEDENNLNSIIIEKSMKDNIKPISISKYVRQLIINHIVGETSIEKQFKK